MRRQKVVDLGQNLGNPQVRRLCNRRRKIAPEPRQNLFVIPLPGRDIIQLRLKVGGKVILDIAPEKVGQKRRDQPALILGDQPVLVFADIFAVLDRGQNRGIGGRSPDPQLLHPLDQRGFGIARRWLGKMLLRRDFLLVRLLALHDLRQTPLVVLFVVAALVIDLQKAVKQHDLPIRAQADLPIRAGRVHHGPLHPRRRHLAGNRALPDQVVQLALIRLGKFQRVRRRRHLGRPDTFMRFLRVLGLVLVDARAVGHIGRAKLPLDLVPRRSHRFRRHVDAVGPHIGDVARLIQTLCRRHAGLGPHAVFAARLLLQGRGHEGRIGVARRRLSFDPGDGEFAMIDRLHCQFGRFRGRNVEFVQPLATQQHQPRVKVLTAWRGHHRPHRPEFPRPERLDLHLAFDDQTQADRLHPPRRPRPRQLAPQHRRQGEPHQIVQRAPRQIRLDQRHIHLPRVFHCLGHR